MNLYIINIELSDESVKYLLDLHTLYNNEICNIEIINKPNIYTFPQGYLDKLTIGKLKYQESVGIKYYIKHDVDDVIYYLVQTYQINFIDIFKICRYNASKCLKVLFDQGINVNIQDNWGNTPLHCACCNNSVESVKLLILNGAKTDIQDNHGRTPLHGACYNISVESVKLLLNNGAKKDIQDNDSFTPLQIALKHNAKDCIPLLQDL